LSLITWSYAFCRDKDPIFLFLNLDLTTLENGR
jgi:hypothetical protein